MYQLATRNLFFMSCPTSHVIYSHSCLSYLHCVHAVHVRTSVGLRERHSWAPGNFASYDPSHGRSAAMVTDTLWHFE